MLKVLLTGFCTCIFVLGNTQIINIQNGASSKGLANIRSISPSPFSINNNPAYLIHKKKRTNLGLGFYQMYNLSEFNSANFLFTHQNTKNF